MDDDIRFEIKGGFATITLDRPKALNALTLDQIRKMDAALARWASGGGVRAVVVRATGGKAFCAGGDIRAIYDARQRGDWELLATFYREEYVLNRRIKTYPKPYIALIDGIVMGGGVGISIHGKYRVATEKTLFAMPETGIGLFPDVGGSYFLPRLPGATGMYLALTGARLKAADCLYLGLATHYVPEARLPELEQALREDRDIDGVLSRFSADPGAPPLAEHRAAIDRCFAGDSVEAVLAALDAEGTDWARGVAEGLAGKSPTSLKVTFRQMRLGRDMDFDEAMRMEYRLSQHFMAGHDFFEGVRALLVDKDQTPRWQPAALAEVDEALVEAHFAPLPAGRELAFD